MWYMYNLRRVFVGAWRLGLSAAMILYAYEYEYESEEG